MAAIKDVARRAGVSQSTVSYALSGKRPISHDVRQRIAEAITELNFAPSAIARGAGRARRRAHPRRPTLQRLRGDGLRKAAAFLCECVIEEPAPKAWWA